MTQSAQTVDLTSISSNDTPGSKDIEPSNSQTQFKSLSAPVTASAADNEVENHEDEQDENIEDNEFQKKRTSNPNRAALNWGIEVGAEEDLFKDEDLIVGAPPTPPRHSIDRLDIDNDIAHIKGFLDEDQQSFIEAIKENAHTLLERECTVREVIVVWENCSKFIILKLLEGFAVRIAGLGTFTHAVLPNDLTKGNLTLRKNRKFPVFKLSPHLLEMYGLIEENDLYHCNAPIVALNLSVIASDTKLPRGIVDGIITEVLQAFARGIITNKNLEFPFPFIGKLFIQNRRVCMVFYQQFCEGLSFDFVSNPSSMASVFPGSMSPLSYHRPQSEFHSVFHFRDVRSVDETIAAKPRPYAKGQMVRDESENVCDFLQKLHTHSNLLFHCTCCEEQPCQYSRNLERIQKSCCTQHGNFSFQQPDGSRFSPQPLYNTAKTGNPILDRLTDDKCLLQQAIGCWMKRDFINTLGVENVAKHYNRNYFHKKWQQRQDVNNSNLAGNFLRKKSYLVRNSTSRFSNSESYHSAPGISETTTAEGAVRSSRPSTGYRQNEENETQRMSFSFDGDVETEDN